MLTTNKADILRRLCLLALCWPLSGCLTQWHYDLGAPLYKVDMPEPDQGIVLQQALDQLGPPQRMSASDSGFILAWEHWHIRESSLGLSLGAMGTDLFSLDWGQMRAKGEFLLLTFDRQHRLTSAKRSDWDNHSGGGKAIQPFLSMVSLTDVDDLVVILPQHRWGSAFLRPLPRTLNDASNPDSGQSGIEQRGTPVAIGQRTLEMD
jgi:hypothetical protein